MHFQEHMGGTFVLVENLYFGIIFAGIATKEVGTGRNKNLKTWLMSTSLKKWANK